MKKIIFSYLHYMGWGDTLISLFDILNAANRLKEIDKEIEIVLIVNDCSDKKVKDLFFEVFDSGFFETFFHEVIIQKKRFEEFCIDNSCYLNNEKFDRIYSGRNYENKNNIPGIFDVYCSKDYLTEFKSFNFLEFTFNDNGTEEIKDFPIFNQNIIQKVNNFIDANLGNNFESIHYRISDVPMEENFTKLQEIKKILKNKLDNTKKYFLISNHGRCKKELSDVIPNCVTFIKNEEHKQDMINGYSFVERSGLSDFVSSIIELIILSRSNLILTYGDYPWISYFTWYARCVKKIQHKFIDSL